MEALNKYNVVLIDDDRRIVGSIPHTIQSWGMEAKGFTHSEVAIHYIAKNKCDIVLLGMFISGVYCLPLIPQLTGDAKIIVMTPPTYIDTAIQALKLGAYDFLEKPLRDDLLRHSVFRTLTVLEKERECKKLADDLRYSRSKLLAQQQRIESLNVQVQETNRAVALFAQSMQQEIVEIEKQAALKLRNILLPFVAKLSNSQVFQEFESLFDMLTLQVEDLISGSAVAPNVATVLSSAELRVASLVRNGATTEKIAAKLHISQNTVRTHRRNIRRKLKIGVQHSLKNILNSRIGETRLIRIRPVLPARRLKELEREDIRLEKLVADPSQNNFPSKEVAKGNL